MPLQIVCKVHVRTAFETYTDLRCHTLVMHWHRFYIFAYEAALRQECNYKGYQPYWDWSKYPDLVNSPIFNGDDWSMGGNGDPVPHKGLQLGPDTAETVPAGPGGGCVTTVPFAK